MFRRDAQVLPVEETIKADLCVTRQLCDHIRFTGLRPVALRLTLSDGLPLQVIRYRRRAKKINRPEG